MSEVARLTGESEGAAIEAKLRPVLARGRGDLQVLLGAAVGAALRSDQLTYPCSSAGAESQTLASAAGWNLAKLREVLGRSDDASSEALAVLRQR